MKTKPLLFFCLWLTLQGCTSQLQEAQKLIIAKKYPQAELLLARLEDKEPDNLEIQALMIQALFHTQPPLKALQKLHPLYRQHPEHHAVQETYQLIKKEFERFDQTINANSQAKLNDYLALAPNAWFKERAQWLIYAQQPTIQDKTKIVQSLSESQDPVIQQLVAWKQNPQDIKTLEHLIDLYPASSLRPLWYWQLIDAFIAAQNHEKANNILIRFKEESKDLNLKAEILLKQGTYNLEKHPTIALNYFRTFLKQFPEHPQGRHVIYMLRTKLGTTLNAAEHLFLAEEAFKRRMYQTAASEIQASHPQGAGAWLQAGIYARKGEVYDLAEEIFSKIIKQYPQSQEAGLAKVQQASLLRIRKAYPTALNQLRAIRKSYTTRPEIQAEALWEEGIVYDFLNQPDKQATVCRELVERAPASPHAPEALWITVWHAYLHQQYEEVIRLIENQRPIFKGHESESRFLYWLARTQEQLNQPEQAQKIYHSLQSGSLMDYYTHRSKRRLKKLTQKGSDSFSVEAMTKTTPQVTLPHWTAAFEDTLKADQPPNTDWSEAEQLFYLKQYPDFLKIATHSSHIRLNQLRGYLLNQKGEYYSAITEYRYKQQLNAYYLPIAFPPAWFKQIQQESSKYQLSPFLVAGLIWQESQYKPDIQSWVGATGLMQIMPATAEQIAAAIGLKQFNLKEPTLNLQMGTWYLNSTHQKFKGNSLLAVASYNAGPGASERWRKQFPTLPDDALAEAITYPETRDYVKKVFTAGWIYEHLYANPYG